MTRHMWVLEVRPGYEEEYKRRHDEIWPEMLDALREAGIRNYSIFRHGLHLFGYFETDDFERAKQFLATDEVNARWSEWFQDVIEERFDEQGRPLEAEEVWHLD